MQNIAWQANGQGEYNVPGLSALLLQRNHDNQEALQNIGQFAGAMGAAAIGAHQASEAQKLNQIKLAANDPTASFAFGADTSPTSAALQGGLMNFGAAYGNGGGGGGGFGGFSRLVNNGGGSGDPETNFKKFEHLGKMADSTRAFLTDPASPLKDQKVMGFTDDQWKHLGTADKIGALQSYKQAMDQKTMLQGYDIGQAHLADMLQKQQEAKAASEAEDRYNKGVVAMTNPIAASNSQTNPMQPMPGIGDPTRPLKSPYLDYAAQSLENPAPLNGAEMQRLAAQAGMSPAQSLLLSRQALDNAKAEQELRDHNKVLSLSNWKNPVTGRNYTVGGNTVLPSKTDDEILAEATAKAKVVGANQRLSAISKALESLNKLPSSAQKKPETAARKKLLEEEQQALLQGGNAETGAAPANNADPLGLFGK